MTDLSGECKKIIINAYLDMYLDIYPYIAFFWKLGEKAGQIERKGLG